MASYIVPSKSRSGGYAVYSPCEEAVPCGPVYGPKNTRNIYQRYDYLERLAFSLKRKWLKNAYECQYKLAYYMQNGAIWYDAYGQTWVQVPKELFIEVNNYVWDEMLKEARRNRKRHNGGKHNRIKINICDYPCDPDVAWGLHQCEDSEDDAPILRQGAKKKERVYHAEVWPEDHIYEQEWELVRNPNLLDRLKARLFLFKFVRKPLAYLRKFKVKEGYASDYKFDANNEVLEEIPLRTYRVVEQQMEEPHGENEQVLRASNVVIGETQVESVADEGLPVVSWVSMSSNEAFDSGFDRVLDRFTFIDSIQWHMSDVHPQGMMLADMSFPQHAIDKMCQQNRGNVPFCVPFNIYRYWHGDMEIKLQINSNKFQTGRLQVSWYYYDTKVANDRDNMWICSQLPHCIINAGSSNESTLVIPYKHWKPLLSTRLRKGYVKPLHLGTLFIHVLAPLTIGPQATSPKSASISILVRLRNSKFTGLADGGIALSEQQMFKPSALASAASSVLKQFNCDNPTSTSVVPYLVPTGSHSWCAGTGVTEVLHNLRLDYNCLGVNRAIDHGTSETTIANIVSHFGLLEPFVWSVDGDKNNKGSVLFEMNVHPIVDKSKVHKWNHANTQLSNYAIPPVGVVSSMFMYWRGSLEIRFDIVASQFHTGRLLVAYVPGISGGTQVTLEQARNSAHAIFSLQESQSFTFVVPYIADKPWWHRRYAGPQRRREIAAPSKLFVFVLNPLTPMDQVASTVTVLPYIRGGSDFEVAVPVQPALGLNWNDTIFIANDYFMRTVPGYAPIYFSTWHSFGTGRQLIARYGPGSDHVAQWTLPNIPAPPNSYAIWELQEKINITPKGKPFTSEYYLCAWKDSGYIYMFPVLKKEDAKAAALCLYKGQKPTDFMSYLVQFSADSSYGKSNPAYCRPEYFSVEEITDYEVIEKQSDERGVVENVMSPVGTLPSSSYGITFFNENFGDLKDLCRRYQLLYSGAVELNVDGINGRDLALFTFPAIPRGLDLVTKNKELIWNIMRDGHIPLICDGFRFFRGSLRYKIVLPNDFDFNVWVQHHPDKPFDGPAVLNAEFKNDGADLVRNHTYAYYIQSTKVNNIVEFEVPCYIAGNYLVTGKRGEDANTDASDFYSLGEIAIGIDACCASKSSISFSLYYSFADDACLNVFTGFGAKVFCDEAYSYAEPQMMSWLSSVSSATASQMLGSLVTKTVDGSVSRFENRVKNKVMDAVTPLAEELSKEVLLAKHGIETEMHEWMSNVGMTVALSQLMHVLVNPTPASLAVSFISILAIMCQASVSALFKILQGAQEGLTKLFTRFWPQIAGQSSDLQGDAQQHAEFQSEFLDELSKQDVHHISSIIFTLWASAMGITCVGPSKYPNFMRGVFTHVGILNNVGTLLKNMSDTIMYCVRHLLGATSEKRRLEMIVESNVIELREWVLECNKLLDPRMFNNLLRDQQYSNRVFDACLYGSILVTEDLHKTCPKPRIILDTYKELCKLRDRIIAMGNHPDVRFECFVVWLAGHRGIGKSFMTDTICAELLRAINYQTNEAMIYWLTSTTKYWNGVRNPPVIARDDAFNLNGTLMEEELGNYFMIKSSSVLNPNMAAVEDKNKRLNPLIYFLNSNFTFPVISPAKLPSAVYRRRQALIEARFTDEILQKYGAGDPENISSAEILMPEERENFKHLLFRYSRNPAVDKSEFWTNWMSYEELMQWLRPKFIQFYQQEQKNFQRRVQTAYSLSSSGVHDFNLPDLEVNSSLRSRVEQAKQLAARRLLEMRDETIEDPNITSIVKSWGQRLVDWWDCRVEKQSPEPTPGCSFWDDEPIFQGTTKDLGESVKFEVVRTIFSECGKDMFAEWFAGGVWNPSNKFLEKWMEYTGLQSETLKIMLEDIQDYRLTSSQFFDAFCPKKEFIDQWPNFYPIVLWGIDLRLFTPTPFNTGRVEGMETLDQAVNYWRLASYRVHSRIFRNHAFTHDQIAQKIFGKSYAEIRSKEYIDFMTTQYVNNLGIHCKFTQFWLEYLPYCSEVQYCSSRDRFIYKNPFGFTTSVEARCNCKNCPMRNPMLSRLLAYVWNQTHPNIQLCFNNSSNDSAILEDWLEKAKSFASCAWNHYLKPFATLVLAFIIKCIPIIVKILLSLAIAMGIRYTASKVFGPSAEIPNVNFNFEPTDFQVGKNYFKFDSPKFKNTQNNFNKGFQQSSEQRNAMARAIINNTVILACAYVENGRRMNVNARCLMVRGRSLLMLRHYYEECRSVLDKRPTFTLHFNVGGAASFREVLFEDVFGCMKRATANDGKSDSNYCLCELPNFIPQFKSIIKFFATASQHLNLSRTMDLHCVGDQLYCDLEFKREGKFIVASNDEVCSNVVLENAYTYNVQGRGMCGSVLVCNSVNNGNGAIVGMHVAGAPSKGKGIAEPLFREMFDCYISHVNYPVVDDLDLKPIDDKHIKLNTNLMLLGKVDAEFSHHESGKSRIVPSLIAGAVYPVITEVNPLKPNDPRQPEGSHPLYDGCNKHGTGHLVPFPKDIVDIVKEDLSSVLNTRVLPVRNEVSILTEQQAICGDPDVPHFESLNWTSSEGFPMSVYRPKGAYNKKWLFKLKETQSGYELLGMDERLKTLILARRKAYREGTVPPTIYVDCLKDYRLSPEKCKMPGKTRIFSISPIQTTIDVKVHLGDFMASYKQNFIASEHAIGINPDSLDWTQVVHYLGEVGTKIVTGDYSNFGPCLNSEMVSVAADNIKSWHEFNHAAEEHCNYVHNIIREEIMNPLHLCEDIVYQTHNGIASGSAMTGEINSEVNKAYIRVVYMMIMRELSPKHASMAAFRENVRLLVYGDDFILSVSDEICEYFNLETIIRYFQKLNIKVTSASKTDVVEKYTDLSQATFLKRGFKKHPWRANIVLAPVDINSVQECVNWVHKSNDPAEALLECCRASMDLAYGHGPEYYKQHGERLVLACRQHNIVFQPTSWRDRDNEIFGDGSQGENISLRMTVPWFMRDE
ncbi:hypothetical protein [Hubei picorna-like virus 28]|uniref:hypothetical protein n=1 Tax=Hubei picorna-like virus 28 TaxID=1923108 RepID=UPI00090C77D0|nr:hypothetical protein [Hubei picorna-like virus 28]APG77971.1 hypothetical protein [Hubei picorna-like virus 28]